MDKNAIKYREMYNAALQWLVLKVNGGSISNYLKSKKIDNVAIYGMSDLGNCLYQELITNDVKVIYTIDEGFPKLYYDITCYSLSELKNKTKPDAIIITLPHLYEVLLPNIKKYCNCKIMSITELAYNAMYEE